MFAFVGAFDVPKTKIAALKTKVAPQLTSLDELADEPTSMRDSIYEGQRLQHRRLFDEDQFADSLDGIRAVLRNIAKTGGKGSGAVVCCEEEGREEFSIVFEVSGGKVSETRVDSEEEANRWRRTASFNALIKRRQAAAEAASAVPREPLTKLQQAILAWLRAVSDEDLMRGARDGNFNVGHTDVRKGLYFTPLASDYRDAARLRKALEAAVAAPDKEAQTTSGLADTALQLHGYLDEAGALATLRRCVDGPMTDYVPGRNGTHGVWRARPLARTAYELLARSTNDADLELLLKGLPQFGPDCWYTDGQLYPAAMACPQARHPRLDARLLSDFEECVGAPGDWKPFDDSTYVRATFLASLLYARRVKESRDRVERAIAGHPDERLRECMRLGGVQWKSRAR